MVVPLGSVSRAVVCVVLVVIGSAVFECDAQLLPQDEVDTLKTIATKLQNKYWNVSETSCSGGLNVTYAPLKISNVTCNCSFNDGTVCHVTNIQLKGLNLTGIFPDEFGNLTYLTEIDLSLNYINGTLPTTLTQIPLTKLSTLGNRISRIPKEIGNISTLEELVLEDNLLEGALEPNIGNLSRLRRLLLSANNFTGTIPELFGNLKNLQDFRIDGSTLSGKIPDFIGNWTRITRLDMQGTSMEGPIPSSISLLTNLKELRISDLKGPSSNFPDLKRMNMMQYLILRNCLLTGSIPGYIGQMTSLNTLDLSDNKLTGQVPDTMGQALNFMFLTNNSLTGAVPTWVTSSKESLDLSYNNFTGSPPISCQQSEVNLVSSYSSNGNNSLWCLEKDLSCSGKAQSHSFFYQFLGRRIFDVSIQGHQVLKDFNIVEEAGGKGTTAIPDRGIYGPLISAIAVTSNFHVGSDGLSAGAITGIAVASVFLLVFILLVLWRSGFLGGREVEDPELRGLDLQTGHFTLRQIKAATGNFDSVNKIGEGGFGPVYKGILSDGTIIAVKQLSSKSKQGNREFLNEIGMISALQHPNLVKLYGCCVEGNQLLLVYEYLENNSLARALFGREEQLIELDWDSRKKIYFGLAKLDEEENTHISTRIAGTLGYMAPEYAMRGYLTDKADVYSFGIVALEIVSGKSNTNYRPKEEFVYLLDWAYVLQEQGNVLELVDPRLGSDYSEEEAMRMLNLALLCSNPSPTLRPPMSSVVSMLEGKSAIQAPMIKRTATNSNPRFRALEIDSQTDISTFSRDTHQVPGSMSMQGPWIDSSAFFTCNDETHDHSSESKLLPDF
ncbi:hypothetical protein NL676_023997 [Syzygium grande]|nr:hypothetical protein NL676_023997 [Syzygium grande]